MDPKNQAYDTGPPNLLWLEFTIELSKKDPRSHYHDSILSQGEKMALFFLKKKKKKTVKTEPQPTEI